ncbi:SOS response-associated peptidase [Synoicihabitans lomoniglobus]|uniref:Abasic site processing protein n=1 Tax=Synoicihabitans lomoniglobus TaxID=2909285 RepID=A0AAE9ZX82_9BACT|nr:SOS response-associated peptidase [Opitutaceae bacterium LMO-M01]WED64884.1 SOS response-associated peptidase [Opitutaceae bacterium LMO-M01]
MCSRFTLNLGDAINLSKRLGIPLAATGETVDRFNIAPATSVTAFRHQPDRGAIEAASLHWGLVPSWTHEDRSSSGPLINARSETVPDKPSFRGPWRQRQRCAIPASGFYEWEKVGRARLPWLFAMSDRQPFAFAGLWDRWQDPVDDTVIESCTVLTTTPNSLLARIHDRMPVLLDETSAPIWLDPQRAPADAAALMRPFDADRMTAVALDPYVNSTAHDDPACLTPRGETPGSQFDLGL